MQTNYSLINYNNNISIYANIRDHYSRRPTVLFNSMFTYLSIRFYPMDKMPKLVTEKLLRRILYPFYHGEISHNLTITSKQKLPSYENMIINLSQYSISYNNKAAFIMNLREIWTNKSLYEIEKCALHKDLISFYDNTTVSNALNYLYRIPPSSLNYIAKPYTADSMSIKSSKIVICSVKEQIFFRRLLYKYYHGEIYNNLDPLGKNHLPDEKSVIACIADSKYYQKDKESFYNQIRTFYENTRMTYQSTRYSLDLDYERTLYPNLDILRQFIRATCASPKQIKEFLDRKEQRGALANKFVVENSEQDLALQKKAEEVREKRGIEKFDENENNRRSILNEIFKANDMNPHGPLKIPKEIINNWVMANKITNDGPLTRHFIEKAMQNLSRKLFHQKELYLTLSVKNFLYKKLNAKLKPYILCENAQHMGDKIGMWNRTKSFIDSSDSNDHCFTMLTKIIYHMVLSEENLNISLTNVFRPSQYLQISYYYPLLQDMLRTQYGDIRLSPDLLNYFTQGYIKYDSYHHYDISMQQVVEAIVIKETLMNFLEKNKLRVSTIAQNPDNINDITAEDKIISQTISKQKFADLMLDIDNEKKIVKDIKLQENAENSLSFFKGSLSFAIKINSDKLLTKYRGELGRILTDENSSKLTSNQRELLKFYKKTFEDLLRNKELTLNEKNIKLQDILNNIDLEKNITFLSCTRIVELTGDIVFDDFFETVKKENYTLKALAEKMPDLLTMNKKGAHNASLQKENIIFWKDIMVYMITKLPERFHQKLITMAEKDNNI